MLNDIRRVGKEHHILLQGKKWAALSDPWLARGGQITIENKIYSIIDQSESFMRDRFILKSGADVYAQIESLNAQNSRFKLIVPDNAEYKFIVG